MIIENLKNNEILTTLEQQIANYILKYPKRFLKMTTLDLAKVTYTSQSTIVRLAKKIGAENYNDFKLRFSNEYLENSHIDDLINNEPIVKEDNYEEIIDKIPSLYEVAITNTKAMLTQQQINRILHLLDKAEKIDIYGHSITHSVAIQAAFKFKRLGYHAEANDGLNEHYIYANRKNKNLVVFILSFTGKNKTMIDFTKYFNALGIKVIGIIGSKNEELERYCSEIIYIEDMKSILGMEVITATISAEYIFDILFSLLLVKNYDYHIENALDVINLPYSRSK